MSAPAPDSVGERTGTSDVDVSRVLAAVRDADAQDRAAADSGPVRSDRRRVAAARRALRAYAPYAPTDARRLGTGT
ncbi:hypothetical protein [Patulibacter minatonensis]|uniref:hypothetical protein n=1 Tax=Patulibacter minatonensis TaxID=298163 RepID=UPI00047D02AC|nr:hypothetical protein [Patulibacter minatonensis]